MVAISGQTRSHAEMIDASIKPVTLASYNSAITQHKRRGYSVSYDGVQLHLRQVNCQLSKAQARNLINALQHELKKKQRPPLTETQRANLFAYRKALQPVRGLDEKPKKGAVTLLMFKQLLRKLRRVNQLRLGRGDYLLSNRVLEEMHTDYTICWLTGMRNTQTGELRRSDFSKVDGKWWLKVPKGHDRTNLSKDRASKLCYALVEDTALTAILEARLNSLKEDDLVCPFWSARQENIYRQTVHDMADILRWPQTYGLRFNGVHCFRHGSSGHVYQTEGFRKANKFLGNNKLMTKHYTKDNAQRVTRVVHEVDASDSSDDEREMPARATKRGAASKPKPKSKVKKAKKAKVVKPGKTKPKAKPSGHHRGVKQRK